MNTPQIIQIIRRTDQGATRPFVCRAADGYVYYVKGHYMQHALSQWSQAWQQLPDDWLDENQSTGAFDDAALLQRLKHDQHGAIWRDFHP